MKTKTIDIKFQELDFSELTELEERLVGDANKVIDTSYSVYSHFSVACALWLDNGEVVCGTNQENVAYPSGLCAERVAVFFAKSKFPDAAIKEIAITAKKDGEITETPVAPCGACLQVIAECEKRQGSPIAVLLAGREKCYRMQGVKDFLPIRFDEF